MKRIQKIEFSESTTYEDKPTVSAHITFADGSEFAHSRVMSGANFEATQASMLPNLQGAIEWLFHDHGPAKTHDEIVAENKAYEVAA